MLNKFYHLSLEPRRGIEPPIYGLQNRCSTIELSRQLYKPRNPNLKRECYEVELTLLVHFMPTLKFCVANTLGWWAG